MASLLNNFYEKLRSSLTVSEIARNHIPINKKGSEYVAKCPFHSEKTPSFTINDRKRFFHCFGCGAHGDLIKFEADINGLSYKDAAYKIASHYGISIPKFSKAEEIEYKREEKLSATLASVNEFFRKNLNQDIKKILSKRLLSEDIINNYEIGYAPGSGTLINFAKERGINFEDLSELGLLNKTYSSTYREFFRNRIIIPIISNFGRVIGFGARALNDEMPKYINSSESLLFKKGESVYGENIATPAAFKSGYFILVEGYFDVISLHNAGFKEAVACLGTAVTKSHFKKLFKIAEEVIVCLDGDSAGKRAAQKIIENSLNIISSNTKISFINLPGDLDPEDIINQKGGEYFSNLIARRISYSEQVFRNLTLNKKHYSAEDKSSLEKKLDDFAEKIEDSFLKKNFKFYFKNRCWKLFNNKLELHDNKNLYKKSLLSDIDKINAVILGIIINKYSYIINDENYYNEIEILLEQIVEDSEQFKEVSSIILDLISESDDKNELNLPEILKKTSFYKEFEILSAEYKNSIPKEFEKQNSIYLLKYFINQKYLLQLKNEFSFIIKQNVENIDKKTKFYKEEISNIEKKIKILKEQISSNN